METNEPFAELWAHTQSKLSNINFKWTINNFSFCYRKIGEVFQSPAFSSEVSDEIKWALFLYPNGLNEYCSDKLSVRIYLASKPSNVSKVLGKIHFSILSTEPRKSIKLTSEVHPFHDKSYLFENCIVRRALLNETNGFLQEDKLTFYCEVSFVCDSKHVFSHASLGQFKIPEKKITDDLATLLISQKFSDVTLVVGQYEFPAHKAILTARSNVFAAMFEHEMEELKTGRVTITDVNPEVLQEMLHYIYTGDAPKLKEMANHLLAAADKYALEKLKVMAEEALFAKLSFETAVETLKLADLYGAAQLKQKTIHFIKSLGKDIIKTKEWQNNLNANVHSPLLDELLETLLTGSE